MTEGNTHPGPTFKARLLRTKYDSEYQTTRFRKAADEIFPTTPSTGPRLLLMWSYRALKIGPGGCYLTYVAYGVQPAL